MDTNQTDRHDNEKAIQRQKIREFYDYQIKQKHKEIERLISQIETYRLDCNLQIEQTFR